MVVVDRRLAELAREGRGQLPARVDRAEEDVGEGVAGLDAGEPGLDQRRRAPSTRVRSSGRPLKSTTTTGLPVAATASRSSSCMPGRSRSLRALASPLISRVSPRASTTWSAAWAAATAAAKPASHPQPARVGCSAGRSSRGCRPRVGTSPSLAAPSPASNVTTSRLAAARPGAEHVGRFVAEGPDESGRQRRLEREGAAAVLQQHGRPACRRAGRRHGVGDEVWPRPGAAATATYGCSNSPARNFTRRILRTASSSRFIEMRPSSSSSSP